VLQVSGLPSKKGTPVLVMLSGFCDDHGSFSEVVPRFQDSHTVVTMVMPDYDTKALAKFWGYSVNEVVQMFRNALDAVVPEGDKATLVAHDWGAAVAQWYLLSKGSQKVDKMVLMDVGNKIPENIGNLSAVLPYQLWLSFCFLMERCTFPLLGGPTPETVLRFRVLVVPHITSLCTLSTLSGAHTHTHTHTHTPISTHISMFGMMVSMLDRCVTSVAWLLQVICWRFSCFHGRPSAPAHMRHACPSEPVAFVPLPAWRTLICARISLAPWARCPG
jgi:hypothetical protein